MIGELEKEMNPTDFLNELKKQMGLQVIRHTKPVKKSIKTVEYRLLLVYAHWILAGSICTGLRQAF